MSLLNPQDKIPTTHPNRQFPGGDIDAAAVERADALLTELQTGTREDQRGAINRLRKYSLPSWRSITGLQTGYGDLMYLCDAWGATTSHDEAGRKMAQIGMMNTLAFAHKTHLFPLRFNDFSEEILTMSTYDYQRVESFASDAWTAMHQSHEKIYGVLGKLARHSVALAEMNGVEDMQVVFEAAAAVPYLLACTTRMDAYMASAVTSVNKYGRDLSDVVGIANT